MENKKPEPKKDVKKKELSEKDLKKVSGGVKGESTDREHEKEQ
jgi:bacteriocin-like protein